jgi:hypothetical protein
VLLTTREFEIRHAFAALCSTLAVLACAEPTGLRTHTVTFCGHPEWVAVKNEPDGAWAFQTVNGTTVSSVDFASADRFTIAYRIAAQSQTTILSMTVDDLQDWRPSDGSTCLERAAKTLTGSFTGLSTGESVLFFSPSHSPAVPSGSSFQIAMPAAPSVVIGRVHPGTLGQRRVIIRRNVDLPASSAMPLFDFASSEAVRLDSAPATVAGATSFGTIVHISNVAVSIGQAAVSYLHAVPITHLEPGDYHEFVASNACEGACYHREVRYRYRVAAPTSLALGPPGVAALSSTMASSPCLRKRVEIAVQSEYSAAARVLFVDYPSIRSVVVGATRSYLGSNASAWTLDVPTLQHPNGSCMLDAEFETVVAWVGSRTVLGREGDVMRGASVHVMSKSP